jgi:hypothetical protein
MDAAARRLSRRLPRDDQLVVADPQRPRRSLTLPAGSLQRDVAAAAEPAVRTSLLALSFRLGMACDLSSIPIPIPIVLYVYYTTILYSTTSTL